MNNVDRRLGERLDEPTDANQNGIDDAIEPPIVDITAGTGQLDARRRNHHGVDPTLSGGDIDARWEDAESGGDETVAGSTATPGQNDVEAIGRALGVAYADGEPLKAGEREADRDRHRWELDPASSEDYLDRMNDAKHASADVRPSSVRARAQRALRTETRRNNQSRTGSS